MVYEVKVSKEIILNYIMVHAKENLNLVFTATWNHFEIEVIKRSFQSTFGNWRTNPKSMTNDGKYFYMQRPINVAQDVAIYA